MRSSLTSVAVGFLFVFTSPSLAQFGRPAPRPLPPIQPPHFVPPPRMPIVPPHTIGVVPPTLRVRPELSDPSGPAQAASTVGLLGSPLGQGPLLPVSSLCPDWRHSSPVADGVEGHAEPVVGPVERAAKHPDAHGPDSSADSPSWVVALVVGLLLVFGSGVALIRATMGSGSMGRVRIKALPPGEAPEEIRRAWIGLELPIANGQAEGPSRGVFGVLSNQPASCCEGYPVDGAQAVRILAAEAPDAAEWWRSNAPHVLIGGYQLVFPAYVCEQIG
jgi:hypothetical protein